MRGLSIPARLALSLTCLTITVLLLARFAGLLPDDRRAALRERSRLCEMAARQISLRIANGQSEEIPQALESLARFDADITQLSVTKKNADEPLAEWFRTNDAPAETASSDSTTSVPIVVDDKSWGRLEARFTPIEWTSTNFGRLTLLILVVVVGSSVSYYYFLRQAFRELTPQKEIPARVRMALDTIGEGLLMLDDKGLITLANAVLANKLGKTSEELVGMNADDLPWELPKIGGPENALPWQVTLEESIPCLGGVVHFTNEDDARHTFSVNATPIHDQAGQNRGALVSFDDITQLERNKRELQDTLENLKKSSEEVRRQNRELEHLATRDPLTSCLNRRSFFERFESVWKAAERHGHSLSCVMVDVDHFKLVNDNHGHSVGDDVLKRVGQILRSGARDADVVCRYGGEEFAVLLPFTAIEAAAAVAERFRIDLERAHFPQLSITASFGVSSISEGALDVQGLLDQADKCLYVAKRNGRNQVVRWDQLPEDMEFDAQISRTIPADNSSRSAIPFQAVTALISALAYRDVATAEHSRRVADLCVATGEGLMSLSSCYVLENAALLHDIGKIGVPDSILLKPGTLKEEEWEIMRRQERIGVEIIRASFDSKELVSIVANHQAWFGGSPHSSHLPLGEDIPLGARILNIVNAYDAMTSRQVYREPRTSEDACNELRKWAGTQFDPDLVERFIEIVNARRQFPLYDVSAISQETALQLGLQIESLMAALDDQDIKGLEALADRLQAVASKHHVDFIADKASELVLRAQSGGDAAEILLAANELIELCRSTQTSYIRVSEVV